MIPEENRYNFHDDEDLPWQNSSGLVNSSDLVYACFEVVGKQVVEKSSLDQNGSFGQRGVRCF